MQHSDLGTVTLPHSSCNMDSWRTWRTVALRARDEVQRTGNHPTTFHYTIVCSHGGSCWEFGTDTQKADDDCAMYGSEPSTLGGLVGAERLMAAEQKALIRSANPIITLGA